MNQHSSVMPRLLTSRRLLESCILSLAVSIHASPREHPARYSTEQLRADFGVFREAMEEAHSGLYVFRSPTEMASVFETENVALEDGSEWNLYRAVARAISEVQDGHTRVALSHAAESFLDSSDAFLPFEVRLHEERAFLARDFTDDSNELLGSEIVAIHGRPWSEIEAVMMRHLASDGVSRTGERRQLENALTFGRLYQILFGPVDDYALELEQRGTRHSVVVPASSRTRIEVIENTRYAGSNDVERFQISFLPEPAATAVLRIGLFYGDGYSDFIEDAFRQISERGVRRLVLDLRDNGGGVESYGQQLVAHLTLEAFDFYDRAVVNRRRFPSLRLSDRPEHSYSAVEAVESADGRLHLTETYYGFLGGTSPREPYFGGDVYVLADGGSFSTTTDTMTSLHEMGRAVFVGTEAGGSYYGNTSGETARMSLPHTKLRVRIPLERFYNNAAGSEPVDRGLIPDHVVEPSIEDVLAGRDAALEAALALIRADVDRY